MAQTTTLSPREGEPRAVPSPDVRNTITQDAFRLAPELLGTPLSSPWRRGAAMAIDGGLIAVLSSASGVLFGFAAAIVLFRISGRPAPGGYVRKSVRVLLRLGAALILFIVCVTTWNAIDDRLEERERAGASAEEGDDAAQAADRAIGVRAGAEIARLAGSSSEAEAHEITGRLVPALRAGGMPDAEIRDIFQGLAEVPGKPWLSSVSDSLEESLTSRADAPAMEDRETEAYRAVVAYAAALQEGDTAAARALEPAAVRSMASDTIASLHGEIEERERRRAAAAARAERLEGELEEGPGIMAMLRSISEDLGLGLGWAGLYFTTFLTLWKGRTPGKRLMGIRVIRLDGQQIGWWAAFERFGGYAAGVATGLLGFAQIFWDRNRQAVQDKISETVVIREGPRAE